MNKKGWKTAEKMIRPAFWCAQHPKACQNTQHIGANYTIIFTILKGRHSCYSTVTCKVLSNWHQPEIGQRLNMMKV